MCQHSTFLDIKVPLYAENGTIEAWLIDISARSLTLYRQPTKQGHQTIENLKEAQTLSILNFPNITLNINEIF